MFVYCPISVDLGLQKHTNAIVKVKMGEDGVCWPNIYYNGHEA